MLDGTLCHKNHKNKTLRENEEFCAFLLKKIQKYSTIYRLNRQVFVMLDTLSRSFSFSELF